MNVSDEHQFLYIHIPKSGGMSISSALGLKNPAHMTQSEIIRKHGADKDISNYYKFSFVRNPWDRFVSLYFYCMTGSTMMQKNKNAKPVLDFKSFCEIVGSGFYIGNSYVWNTHYQPQTNFIDLPDIDFVGRFENIQHDFDIVCDKIGFKQKQLPHTNKSKHKHYTKYYDDETREIVAEKYAKDIEAFGYEF